MNRFLLCISLFITATGFAQKGNDENTATDFNPHCKSSFQQVQLYFTPTTESIIAYLRKDITGLHDDRTYLRLNYVKESPGGFHYSFTQTFNGVDVYQSELKINISRNNVVQSVFDNSYYTRSWPGNITCSGIEGQIVKQVNAYALKSISSRSEKISDKPIVFFDAAQPQYGHVAVFVDPVSHKTLEVLFSKSGVVYQHDLNCYAGPVDTLVSAKIFRPDPLTSAHLFYNIGTYYDNNDADAPWLDNQEQTVSFTAKLDSGIFKLENNFVVIQDFDTPQILPVVSTIPQFYFNRSQSGFEDVNAYYHLNNCRHHMDSLGYTLADHLVAVDPHAVSGQDQSFFSYSSNPPRLYYGTGGVDDAEDADVLLHEYGHFLSFNAAPGSNNGSERNSLDEAFGDYNAASYSRQVDTFNSNWVFNWDGHNEFWSGRVVNSTKVYPQDLTTGIYKNAEIWSAVLMEINSDIGRNSTDSLIWEAHYNYTSGMLMSDAAQILLNVDQVLFNGAYHCPIYRRLYQHGFVAFDTLNTCGVSSVKDVPQLQVSFIQQPNSFMLRSDEDNLKMDLVDITGQLIVQNYDLSHGVLNYSNNNLPSGIYMVVVRHNNANRVFKWCKTE